MYFTDLPRDSRFAVLASNANCSSVEKIGESIIVVILSVLVALPGLRDVFGKSLFQVVCDSPNEDCGCDPY